MIGDRFTTEVFVHTANILSANDRKHWGEGVGPKQVLRAEGARAWRELQQRGMKGKDVHLEVDVWVAYPDRRPRDVLNLYPTMKSFIDGIVSAGMLTDDNDLFLSGPFMRWAGRLSTKPKHFEFTVQLTSVPRPEMDRDAMAPSLRYPRPKTSPE